MKKDHPATYSPLLRQQILLRNQNSLNPTVQYLNQPLSTKQIATSMPQEMYRQSHSPMMKIMGTKGSQDAGSNRKDFHYMDFNTTVGSMSPMLSPTPKRQFFQESEELKHQLTQTKNQLKALSMENEILKTQHRHQIQRDQRIMSKGEVKPPNVLNEAMLRMEIDKLRFEVQSRDRSIAYLEERLRLLDEEKQKRRQDNEAEFNGQVSQFKEFSQGLDQALRQQKHEFQQIFKEETAKLNQKIVQLQQQLNENQLHKQSLAEKLDEMSNYAKQKKTEESEIINQLQQELDSIKMELQNEEILREQIKKLQAENLQLSQSNISFDNQKLFFSEQFKQLKDFQEEIIQENHSLQEQVKDLQDQLSKYETQIKTSYSKEVYETTQSQSYVEFQDQAENFLYGRSDDVEQSMLKEAKRLIFFMREKFMELLQEVKQLKLDKLMDADVQRIKNFRKEPDPDQVIKELQFRSDQILEMIQERKQILDRQYNVSQNLRDNNPEMIQELEQLYAEYDRCQQQIQELLRENEKKQRRRSSVSFDQSFDYNLDDV